MRKLARQRVTDMVTDTDIKEINDVYEAFKQSDSQEMLPYNIFMLGFMRGAEFERKKYQRRARNDKE